MELGAYSPSDSKHAFRDFHLEHNYPYQEKKDLEKHGEAYKLRADKLGLNSLNDPDHWWINGHRGDVSLESKQRIMGTLTINSNLPESSTLFQAFPKVGIVTGLLIRRQFYRKIAAKSLGRLLRDTFTCLRWFRHEAWHDVDPQQQLCFEKGTSKPQSLSDFSEAGKCMLVALRLIYFCRLQESNFMEPTEYSAGAIHIRRLQQTSPP